MEDYSAKLTGEPFLYNETKIIATYLLNGEDPNELKKRNIRENLIKQNTTGSLSRTNAPIFRRIKVMSKDLLREFVYGELETSKYILLYSIMKTDRLILDFITEVYKEKLLVKKEYIENYDIDNWFEEKCIMSVSLKNKTDKTKYKLKQVIMKIITDSGLVKKEEKRYKIIRPLLKESFIRLLDSVGDLDYAKAIGGIV